MKKSKFLFFLLSISFLLSAALAACGEQPSLSDSTLHDSSSSEISSSESISSSTPSVSEEENDSSVESSAPEQSEKPEPPIIEPPKPVSYATYIRCTGNSVNLRAGAGTQYAVVGQAYKGGMYAVGETKSGWVQTYYRNQKVYISASYTTVFTLEKADKDVEAVIEQGYKLLGVPYVYGAVRFHDGKGNLLKGFTASKFDCSSLIQYIFYKGAGVLLNTTTRTQVKQGKYVAKADLQRGDCIFFTNEERQNNKGVERIGHVALYLGDGYILHTASDYARIEKMSSKRWSFYIEARRFL